MSSAQFKQTFSAQKLNTEEEITDFAPRYTYYSWNAHLELHVGTIHVDHLKHLNFMKNVRNQATMKTNEHDWRKAIQSTSRRNIFWVESWNPYIYLNLINT